MTQNWIVQNAGRLDKILKEAFPHLSRKAIKECLAQKAIRVDNKIATKAGFYVASGAQISLNEPKLFQEYPEANASESIEILFENEQIIAVNKPHGLPVHPLQPTETDTVVQRLLATHPNLKGIGENRAPGLLHRLDNDTSGVLVFAKTQKVFQALKEALKNDQADGLSSWEKTYVAWVHGKVTSPQTITTPIAHHHSNQKKMVTPTLEAPHPLHRGEFRKAITKITPLIQNKAFLKDKSKESSDSETSKEKTYLEISILTGVRHQIRVHLNAIGHPIVGDSIYGENDLQSKYSRMMLHASSVILPSPPLDSCIQISAACPFRHLFSL